MAVAVPVEQRSSLPVRSELHHLSQWHPPLLRILEILPCRCRLQWWPSPLWHPVRWNWATFWKGNVEGRSAVLWVPGNRGPMQRRPLLQPARLAAVWTDTIIWKAVLVLAVVLEALEELDPNSVSQWLDTAVVGPATTERQLQPSVVLLKPLAFSPTWIQLGGDALIIIKHQTPVVQAPPAPLRRPVFCRTCPNRWATPNWLATERRSRLGSAIKPLFSYPLTSVRWLLKLESRTMANPVMGPADLLLVSVFCLNWRAWSNGSKVIPSRPMKLWNRSVPLWRTRMCRPLRSFTVAWFGPFSSTSPRSDLVAMIDCGFSSRLVGYFLPQLSQWYLKVYVYHFRSFFTCHQPVSSQHRRQAHIY